MCAESPAEPEVRANAAEPPAMSVAEGQTSPFDAVPSSHALDSSRIRLLAALPAHADEPFFSGQRAVNGVINAEITSEQIPICADRCT